MDAGNNIKLEELEFEQRLGKGNFGEVWKGTWLGTPVAIKKLYFVDDDFMQKYIGRETSVLRELNHPHIVQVIGVCRPHSNEQPRFGSDADPRHQSEMLQRKSFDGHDVSDSDSGDVYLVTDFVSGGDLMHMLENPTIYLSWADKVGMMHDVALAMLFLHKHKVMHRDLKSPNLLVGPNNVIKVADFGLARDVTGDESKKEIMTVVGTNEWMAPEVALGDPYQLSADVFSFGMVCYEIITRKKPRMRKKIELYAFNVEEAKKSIPKDTPSQLWDLVAACTARVPEDRPHFEEIVLKLEVLRKDLTEKEEKKKKKNQDKEKGKSGKKDKKKKEKAHKGDGKKKEEGPKKPKKKEEDKPKKTKQKEDKEGKHKEEGKKKKNEKKHKESDKKEKEKKPKKGKDDGHKKN